MSFESTIAPESRRLAAEPSAVVHEPINILIVDDEPKNLTALETVLDDPGYRLVRASSADEALLALVAEEFALLVLDIQMPGMNGFELAQMIKQRKKTASVPIIFLTAFFSEDEHVLEGYSTGAVDYLQKPINATILRSKVSVFAELHRKTRESALSNQALRAEVAERESAQRQLRELNDELERRVAERTARLTQSEARLEAADKRKDEFLAMLGHELRNPLAAIRHAVRIEGEAGDNSTTRQWAGEVIDRQSAQLSRMVDDLLDVERINRGRIELRPEPLQLQAVVARAIEAVRPLLDLKKHTLSVQMPETALAIRGDAARLQQIFVNLLSNAAKYTTAGGSILLTARRENHEAIVAVSDNGVGIAPDLLPQVFDLFTQAQTSLDRAEGGLGIGLTVVRSLTEMHGGSVAVKRNAPAPGTTFTVRLPLLSESPVDRPPTHSPALAPPEPRTLRVLIVDDHIDASRTLAHLLSRRHCEVRVTHDGPSGITAAQEFHPEVFLLDLGLPGLDGYELVGQLRAEPEFAGALFIAISGYAQESDRERSLAAGFDDHCAKPVDLTLLLTAIRSRVAS